uniref:Cytochrome c oxidase subunit 2 n=1 Tax=Therophilus festivus TaxID=1421599 RepID=A0A0A6ZKW6_9HYME|nr:cytochrome c oxidase subunit II [Therophilus festivus]
MYTWMMMNLQDSNSWVMSLMTEFHDFIMMIMFMILFLIFYIIMMYMYNNFINRNILHGQFIEIIWTIIPMLILIVLAIPSLKILYLIEEIISTNNTMKILGNQWYWNYEYSDFNNINYDSFMLKDFNMKNTFRLLDVDNRFILPYKYFIRNLVSSNDVIHSWTIPSLGLKIDANPGRLNQFIMMINRPGLYYGQCSEICGLNHSFMPIVLESINMKNFLKWIVNF